MRATCLTVCLLLGCSISPEGGTSLGGGGGSGDQGSGGDEASSAAASSDGDESSGATATGDAEGSDEGATIVPSDDSSGDAAESSGAVDEGEAGSSEVGADMPPAHDYYQACTSSAECSSDPGLACLKSDQNGAEGFCSPACGTMGASPPDPQLCPPAPDGVTATVVCVEGFIRNCALSCAADDDCPGGTACLPANNGGGPYCYGT